MKPVIKAKNNQYLSRISDPLGGGGDKHDIGRYLQSQGSLLILEIGPGGGKTLEYAMTISDGWHRSDKYVILDFNLAILNTINSNANISNYSESYCIQANALKLPFVDSIFDIINLSAVAHECSSYQGGVSALSELVEECSRVLKNNGLLIFRDLEGANLLEVVDYELLNLPIKVFFELFFRRFLDQTSTVSKKPDFYDLDKILIYIDEKRFTATDYFARNLYLDIDCSLRLSAQIGLIRDLQRHFITFLNAYLPEYFYNLLPCLDTDEIIIEFEKKSASSGFALFAKKNNIDVFAIAEDLFQINRNDFSIFQRHLRKQFIKLLEPHSFRVPKEKLKAIRDLLSKENISCKEEGVFFQLPLGTLLYLDNKLGDLNARLDVDGKILDWSRSEGEEYYFYGDPMELTAKFIEESIRIEKYHDGVLSGYTCLAPLESRFVPRNKYINVLKDHFKQVAGNIDCCNMEGKRIIHFKKMAIEKSFLQITEFVYKLKNYADNVIIKESIGKIQSHIRDYISRSISFNEELKKELTLDPFIEDIIFMEDDIHAISTSKEIERIIGKDILLIGRIATKKEPFIFYFRNKGYAIVSLTDILIEEEVRNSKPTRKDIYFAGKLIRKKHGDDILAKMAVEKITKERYQRFLILGCRDSIEIKYIKKCFPDIILIGLFPDVEQIIDKLRKRYPSVSEDSLRKWIDWNDGMEKDENTNIKTCLQMCDVFFSGLGKDITEISYKEDIK